MKRSVACFFDRFHLFSIGTYFLCGLMLISCSGEHGNWTAAQQEDRYIYGVWQSATAKKAEQLMLEMAENIKKASELDEASSTTDRILQTTVFPNR